MSHMQRMGTGGLKDYAVSRNLLWADFGNTR